MEQGSKCGRWHRYSSRRRYGTDDKVKQHSHKVKARSGKNPRLNKHQLPLDSRKLTWIIILLWDNRSTPKY